MAKNYSEESIFGRRFDTTVNQQLELRSSIVSKPVKTDQQQLYLNGNSAFVVLTSSVNVNGGSISAKENVLFGGTLSNGVKKAGIGIDGNTNPAYTAYDSIGFRPMPGIDSMRVSSKNTFGSLRVATVDFKVWSVEQLTDFEKLYLRPGFSVLLEWGNSNYFRSNDTDFTSVPITLSKSFLNGVLNAKTIYSGIKKLKSESYGNYDAMYGFIRNFSWSYRLDGGYDCTCDIVSIGELSEGLQLILGINQGGGSTEPTSLFPFFNPDSNKSPIHKFISLVDEENTLFVSSAGETSLIEKINSSLATKHNKTYLKFLREIVKKERFLVLNLGVNNTSKGRLRYIRFGDLLALINTQSLKSKDGTILEYNLQRSASRYRTFGTHTSLDPKKCVIPKNFGYDVNKIALELINTLDDGQELIDNSILDIFLEVKYLLGLLDSSYQGKTLNQKSVSSFIKTLLSDIQDNLGHVNSFDYTFDEDAGQTFIIDRNLTPNKGDLSTINIIGLKSLVTNLSLNSKLPPGLANLIAVSAQATTTDIGLEMNNLLTWNKGLNDRIFPRKYVEKDGLTPQEKANKALNSIKNIVSIFNGNTTKESNKSYSEIITSIKQDHIFYSQFAANTEDSDGGKAGIIPFELSVTMDGIGGLKITEAFKINPGILPKQYDNNSGFIITGLDHEVVNNKWSTTIKAQLIII